MGLCFCAKPSAPGTPHPGCAHLLPQGEKDDSRRLMFCERPPRLEALVRASGDVLARAVPRPVCFTRLASVARGGARAIDGFILDEIGKGLES